MPLFVNGKELPFFNEDISTYVAKIPEYQELAKTLTTMEESVVEQKNLLYVGQREFAVTSPVDGHVSVMGTEDATTCHMVVLRHTGSGSTALGHFDGRDTEGGASRFIKSVLKRHLLLGSPEGSVLPVDLNIMLCAARLELHVVGGFSDDRQISKKLSNDLLRAFHESVWKIDLITACFTDLNTEHRERTPFPIIYGIAIDVKTGYLYRATFPTKDPDLYIRMANNFVAAPVKMYEVYKAETGCLVLEAPDHWEEMKDLDRLLAMSYEELTERLSTSPAQEKPNFGRDMWFALSVIKENPDPFMRLFPDHKARKYVKDDKNVEWVRA